MMDYETGCTRYRLLDMDTAKTIDVVALSWEEGGLYSATAVDGNTYMVDDYVLIQYCSYLDAWEYDVLKLTTEKGKDFHGILQFRKGSFLLDTYKGSFTIEHMTADSIKENLGCVYVNREARKALNSHLEVDA